MRYRLFARPAVIISALIFALIFGPIFSLIWGQIGTAIAQQTTPNVVPLTARIANSPSAVFGSIKNYLSPRFTLSIADSMSGRIVAKRTGINPDAWTTWAYCKVPAQDMLGDMLASSVVLTITVRPGPGNSSAVSVGADFQATYSINGNATPVACVSNNVLENEILDSAGARVS